MRRRLPQMRRVLPGHDCALKSVISGMTNDAPSAELDLLLFHSKPRILTAVVNFFLLCEKKAIRLKNYLPQIFLGLNEVI